MVRIGVTNQWTVKWENLTSEYQLGEYYIKITAIDNSISQNRNSTGYLKIIYVASVQPSFPGGGDDDDDDNGDEEVDFLTSLINAFTEFITDLTTNPLNLFIKPTNLMFLGIIVGITLGLILIIRKGRKRYKTSDKKIREIQELIEK